MEYACLEAIQHNLRRGSAVDLGAADAYSLGVTLYRLATGDVPLRVGCAHDEHGAKWHERKQERRLLRMVRGSLRHITQLACAGCSALVCGQCHPVSIDMQVWRNKFQTLWPVVC